MKTDTHGGFELVVRDGEALGLALRPGVPDEEAKVPLRNLGGQALIHAAAAAAAAVVVVVVRLSVEREEEGSAQGRHLIAKRNALLHTYHRLQEAVLELFQRRRTAHRRHKVDGLPYQAVVGVHFKRAIALFHVRHQDVEVLQL